MSLADTFSGGADSDAADVLSKQLASLNNLKTPTAEQLTLPQLERYVQMGILTPEQAQAYLVNSNALDKTTSDNAGMDTELSTIGELQNIVNQGGSDAQEQADIQKVLNQLSTTEHGNTEAINRDAAARGVGNSGFTLASKLADEQTSATNANENALNAQAAAEARNVAAINAKGGLGEKVQEQQYSAEANKASAANAIAEFNAQQNQDISKLNTTSANVAKAANLSNAQDVANKNTVSSQKQEESIPAAQQQAYEDALQKATAGMTGAEALAGQKNSEGQQNAGILGGLVGTAGTVGAAYLTGNPYAALASALANKGGAPNTNVNTSEPNFSTNSVSTGGKIAPTGAVERPLNMKSGGAVPGEAMVPGDSPANDTVPAKLSPGEIVLPRSVADPAMGGDQNKVMQFLRTLPKPAAPSVHPKAVLDTLRALSMHHQGAA